MATKYWVGGSGTWDTTTSTNWSTTGNAGTGGTASAPTISDDVIFGTNAGTGTITVVSGASASNVQVTGGSLAFSFGTANLNVAANFTNTVSFSATGSSGGIYFTGTIVVLGGTAINYNCSVVFTNTSTTSITINGANSFSTLNFPLIVGAVGVLPVYFGANQTITTLTATGAAYNRRLFFRSDTVGVQRTLAITTWSGTLQDMDFRDIAITGITPAITRSGDCGNNSNTNPTAAKTVYYANTAAAGAQNWSSTVWATTAGGTAGNNSFPLAQDTAVISNTSGGGASIALTLDRPWNIGTINATSRTITLTLATSAAATCWQNLNLTGFFSTSGSAYLKMSKPGTSITALGSGSIGTPIQIDCGSGNSISVTGTNPIRMNILNLVSGTFNLAGYDLYLSGSTGLYVTGSGTKYLDFNAAGGTGSNAVYLPSSGISCDTANNFSTGVGRTTGGFIFQSTGGFNWSFNGATLQCPIRLQQTATNNLNILTDVTCSAFYINAGCFLTLYSGATITISDFSGTSTPTFYAVGTGSTSSTQINISGSGSQCYFNMPSGLGSVTIDYLSVSQITVKSLTYWYTGNNTNPAQIQSSYGFNVSPMNFLNFLTEEN